MVFFLSLALTLAACVGVILVPAIGAAAVNKSGDTQAHGVPRSGVVTGVTNYYTRFANSDVEVRLAEPVDGHVTTTAHVHPRTSLKPGATVAVLVDPNDPGYAEFPGQRYLPQSGIQIVVVVFLAAIAFFGFVAVWWGRVWYRERKRDRA